MKALTTLLLLTLIPPSSEAEDACQILIPPALRAQVLKQFAGYRLPREKDNLLEDIKHAREHGESACLGLAIADFDGDGHRDYAIGLTTKSGSALVVVALTRPNDWDIQELGGWPERGSVYPAWQTRSERLHRALQQDLSGGSTRCLRLRNHRAGARDNRRLVERIQRGAAA